MLLIFNPRNTMIKSNSIFPIHGAITPPAIIHFALEIEKQDYVNSKNMLNQNNIEIEKEIIWKKETKSMYFRDPIGNLVEFITRDSWPVEDWFMNECMAPYLDPFSLISPNLCQTLEKFSTKSDKGLWLGLYIQVIMLGCDCFRNSWWLNAPVVYKRLVITHNPFNIFSINEQQSNWCDCKPNQRQSSLDRRAFPTVLVRYTSKQNRQLVWWKASGTYLKI